MLSFKSIKWKQYKKYRQNKNSRNLQTFLQERLLFLYSLPSSLKEDFKACRFLNFYSLLHNRSMF